MQYNFLDYDSWVDNEYSILASEPNTMITCPECNGNGVVSSVCECCDAESEYDCDTCDATGEVSYEGISSADEKKKAFTFLAYADSIKGTLVRLSVSRNEQESIILEDSNLDYYFTDENELIVKGVITKKEKQC